MRVGVVRNPASHANRRRRRPAPDGDVIFAEAPNAATMGEVLRDFARQEIGLLVLEGGDGSLRDMITALPAAFGAAPPLLAVMPAGKTNLLARDLGLFSLDTLPLPKLLAEAKTGFRPERLKARRVLDICWSDGRHAPVSGFFFGAAAFRRATILAQSVHRLGAFQRPAIALTLISGFTRVLAGGSNDPWRAGETMTIALDGADPASGRRFVVLASTLKRFPLRMKPFDNGLGGLRYLEVDAPPQRLGRAIATLMSAEPAAWLGDYGYRRGSGDEMRLTLAEPFVLDGEIFPAGELIISAARELQFVGP